MKAMVLTTSMLLCAILLVTSSLAAFTGSVAEEYAVLTRQVNQAMRLRPVELEGLIARCDKLSEQTASLNASEKKILTRKLKKLRGLFHYVLQSKKLPPVSDTKP